MSKTIEISRELIAAMRKTCKLSIRQWDELNAACAEPVVERQEPVAWLNVATGHVTTSAVVVMDWDDEKEQVQSLYTSPPAPVAVDENAEFEKWRNTQIDVLVRNGYPDGAQAFRNLGSVQWAGWQARAVLAKEINQ